MINTQYASQIQNNANTTSATSSYSSASFDPTTGAVSSSSQLSQINQIVDMFTPSSTSSVYTPSSNMSATAVGIAQFSHNSLVSMQKLVSSMSNIQINTFNKATFTDLNVSQAQTDAAQQAISEGGEWSAESVANRIVDMAKALSGGDSSKMELLSNAIQKGFDSAAQSWGDSMPAITQETYDLVMQGFSEWESEANGVTTSTPEIDPKSA